MNNSDILLKIQIKNDIAIEKGYATWEDMLSSIIDCNTLKLTVARLLIEVMDEVANRYRKQEGIYEENKKEHIVTEFTDFQFPEEEVPLYLCPCGYDELRVHFKFCPECGAKLNWQLTDDKIIKKQ